MTKTGNSKRAFRASAGGIAAVVSVLAITACGSSSSSSSSSQAQGKVTSAASGDPALAALQKRGYATVGVPDGLPYSNVTTSGGVTGLAPQLTGIIMSKLGVPKLHGVTAGYGALIPGLQANRFDFIAGAVDITKPRCQQVTFSAPFLVGTTSFGVMPGNPDHLTSFHDLLANSSLKLGLYGDGESTSESEKLGLPSSRITEFPDLLSAIEGMDAGRVQAVMDATASFGAIPKKNGVKFDVTSALADYPLVTSSVAFSNSDKTLATAFTTKLLAFMKTPQFPALMKKWHLPVPPAKDRALTPEEACAQAASS